MVIEERWRQNSTLFHFCFSISALRFMLPKMNIGSSVLHIVVEPATGRPMYFGVVCTIEHFFYDPYCQMQQSDLARRILFVEPSFFFAAMSAVIVDIAMHVECFGRRPC